IRTHRILYPALNDSCMHTLTCWSGLFTGLLSVTIARHISFLLVLLLATVIARAQATPEPEQSEAVKALLTRIDKLEQRVAELEGGKNTASTLQPNGQPQGSQISKAEVVEENLATQMPDDHPQNGRSVDPNFPSMQLNGS